MATFTRSISALTKLLKTPVSNANLNKFSQGQFRQQSVMARKLFYSEYGDPVQVIQKHEEKISEELKPTEILVKMLAAPVNPADINTIQGKYPSRPPLPAIAGNEGVAVILKVGSEVKSLATGDHVVPLMQGLGTWRTHAIIPYTTAFRVPKKLGIVEAATLTVNPCTAYRMLRDYINLKPGDCVIQNGANSAVGQYLIQICRVWGIKTVNVVRDRENVQELKDYLLGLGATYVLTEQELRTTQMFKDKIAPKPRLALNCVGGKSATEIMRTLETGCPMVTYGGMSREPVTIPTSALIFKNIAVHGFWMTRWSKENFDTEERSEMFEELISMMISKELRGASYKMVDFDNYKEALENTVNAKGMVGKKYIIGFD